MRVCEELLVRRVRTCDIERAMGSQFRLEPRSVRKYISRVHDRWRAEAEASPRSQRRNHLRQNLEDLYQRSINAREVVRDKDGNPVLDASNRPVTYPRPDVRAAVGVSDKLAKLDGLYEPLTVDAGGALADLMALAFGAERAQAEPQVSAHERAQDDDSGAPDLDTDPG